MHLYIYMCRYCFRDFYLSNILNLPPLFPPIFFITWWWLYCTFSSEIKHEEGNHYQDKLMIIASWYCCLLHTHGTSRSVSNKTHILAVFHVNTIKYTWEDRMYSLWRGELFEKLWVSYTSTWFQYYITITNIFI